MSDTASSATETPAAPARKRRRTWKQRIKLTLIVLVVLLIVFRIGLGYLLPVVINKVAGTYDLDCQYDRLSLGLLGGHAHLWNLQLKPRGGGDSIVQADYVQGSISTPDLLRGRLVVYRAEVDGAEITIEREADGTIPLLARFLNSSDQAPPPPPEEPDDPNQMPDLQAPLRIDAIRLGHVRTTFRDRSVQPVFEATIQTALRLSNVGAADQPAEVELRLDAGEIIDTLRVQGVVRNTATEIDGEFDIALIGLHPKPAAVYFEPLGLRPIADDIRLQAKAALKAALIPDSTDIAAQLTIHDISAEVDSTEWASLKTFNVDVRRANASLVDVAKVLIEGGRASAARGPDGTLRVAGFELVPAAASEPAPPVTQPDPVAAAEPSKFRASLDELLIRDLEARFTDEAVDPTGVLAARLEEMSARTIVLDPAQVDQPMTINGQATLPGIAERIEWTGSATPFAPQRTATVKLTADGIRPEALEPYLTALGIQSQYVAGRFTADLDATVATADDGALRAGVHARNIQLSDQDTVLLELTSARIDDAALAADGSAIHVKAIELSGPTLSLRRESSGIVTLLGLAFDPSQVTTAAPPAVEPAAPSAPAPQAAPRVAASDTAAPHLPRIQIDRIAWDGTRISFADHMAGDEPVALDATMGFNASDLVFDTTTTGGESSGTFSAWLAAPGVAERLEITGSVQPADQGLRIESAVTGDGLTGSAIAEYLAPLGIRPTLTDGTLRAAANIAVASMPDGLEFGLAVRDVRYADGDVTLAALDAMTIDRAVIANGGLAVDAISITGPQARIVRHEDGSIEAAGIHLAAAPQADAADGTAESAPPPPTHSTGPAPLRLPPIDLPVAAGRIQVELAGLQFVDRAVSPALDMTLRGGVLLQQLALNNPQQPMTIKVVGAVDGIAGQLNVDGNVTLAGEAPRALLQVRGEGLRLDGLASYLPPGIEGNLEDGRFTVTLDAGAENHPEGGIAAHVRVSDVLLADEASGATWAKVGAFTATAARIDPAADLFAIEELSSSGVEIDIARLPDGALEAMGIRLVSAPADAGAEAPAPNGAIVASARDDMPAIQAASATTQPAANIGAALTDARRPFPRVTLDKLNLIVDRIRLRGAVSADGKPIEVTNLRVHSPGQVALGGPESEDQPPVAIRIDGGIEPIAREFGIAIEATPFAAEPAVTVNVDAAGISGQGLMDVVPDLATILSGETLTEGTFHTQLTASVNYNRRGPRDFDLGRGFTAHFDIKPVEFRAEPEGPILAGLEQVRGESIQLDGAGNLSIGSVEVVRPIGRIVRDADGIHVLGMVIPERKGGPADGEADTETASAAPPPEGSTPAQSSAPPQRPANEIRLDRFTVSGIDVVVEDRTTDPATIVPLKTLDLEVRDISNQMLWTGRPVRFDMLCTADKIPLPPRRRQQRSAAQVTSDGQEMRELFSQITASGRIGMKRIDDRTVLTGWAKTSVDGFELLGVRGLAKEQEIVIGGGILDDRNDIRFREDGSIVTRNRIVVTNLSMSEPPNGPIQRTLKLTAPIDVVIGALTDPDGSITLNLPVTIESGQVDPGSLVGPAIGAVAQVLTTAVASAPVKAVTGIGGMIGLGGREGEKVEEIVELRFVPGVASPEPDHLAVLAELTRRMRSDSRLQMQLRHEMTVTDVEQSARRANPEPADVQAISERLRREKAALLTRRATLSAEARARYASQSEAAEDLAARVRTIDRQLAQIQTSLDQLYELLRPGAEARADRRTRTAALAVARERLELVRTVLRDNGVRDVDERIHLTNPQFEPVERDGGGHVEITLVPRKK